MKSGTSPQLWPLVTGSNDNPALTQGRPTTFFLNTVPDRAPGGLAYYLPVVLLTIYATLTQPATSGSPVYQDFLAGALLNSVDWINCFHGTVVSSDHVFGAHHAFSEYYANGFKYAGRRKPLVPAAAGAYPIAMTFAITPAVSRIGYLEADTSQLARLFRTSNLKINVADSSVISSISTGATLTNMSARASAVLVPRNELVLGTAVETILEQPVAGGASAQTEIRSFGITSQLAGVEKKGGVLLLAELTNALQQNGVFASANVTRYSFPWRNQQQIQHMEALAALTLDDNPANRPQVFPTAVVGGDSEMAGHPYTMVNSDQQTTAMTQAQDYTNQLAFHMVKPNSEVSLADLQTAAGDEAYFLSVTGGYSVGAHQILGMYARQWQSNFRDKWLAEITDGGSSSLAAHVLGGMDNVLKASLTPRSPRGKHVVTADNLAYLPWQLAL